MDFDTEVAFGLTEAFATIVENLKRKEHENSKGGSVEDFKNSKIPQIEQMITRAKKQQNGNHGIIRDPDLECFIARAEEILHIWTTEDEETEKEEESELFL